MEHDEKPFTPPAYEPEDRSSKWPVLAVLMGAWIIILCCVCGMGIGIGKVIA